MAPPIPNKVWADKCFDVAFEPAQLNELLAALKSVGELSVNVAYEGFSPGVIRASVVKSADENHRKMIKDLISLMTLFHVRGATVESSPTLLWVAITTVRSTRRCTN